MRRYAAILVLSIASLYARAQNPAVDSLKQLLDRTTTDSNRCLLIAQLSNAYKYTAPITGLSWGLEGLGLAKKNNDLNGQAWCLSALGNNYRMLGDLNNGLTLHLDALKIFEKLGNREGIAAVYHGVSVSYEDRQDYPEALEYAYKVIPLARELNNQTELMKIQSNMGKIYERMGKLDSALHYEQNAYEIVLSAKDFSIAGNILGRLGNIYVGMGNQEMAGVYYRMGIPIAILQNDNNSLCELYYDLAKLFDIQSQRDSAIYYGKKGLIVATSMRVPTEMVRASNFLSGLYSAVNKDSAYRYLLLATTTKDSLYSYENLKQIQLTGFEQKRLEQEKAEQEQLDKKMRARNVQFAALGIVILVLALLFLLLSHSIIVNEKWIRLIGVMLLLIVFEFINLLIHPWLEAITHHSPILMLLGLAVIAALLAPFHHWLEKWIKEKVVVRNRRIRLKAAKKIISKLEQDSDTTVE